LLVICLLAATRRALIRVPVRSNCAAYLGVPALDEATASALQRLSRELQESGYRALGQAVESRANGTRSVVSLFVSSAGTSTAALLVAFVGERAVRGPLVNLVSEVETGAKLATTNAEFAAPIPTPHGDRVARFPEARSAAQLTSIHEARLAKMAAAVVPRNVAGEPAAIFQRLVDEDRRRLLAAGILFQATESEYRLRWWAAFRAAVQAVPPGPQLKSLMDRAEASR
jgi:hypothetical protein